jgi:ABC-type transporter MlaC component
MKKIYFLFSLLLCFNLNSNEKNIAIKHTTKKDHKLVKNIIYIIDTFTGFSDNRDLFIKGKASYKDYQKKDDILAKKISKYVDYYDICQKALKYNYDVKTKSFKSDHWKGKSESKKESFLNVFKNLIEVVVYPIANSRSGSVKMEHELSSISEDKASVKTTVSFKTKRGREKTILIDWKFHLKNSDWLIYDVYVEEESWVSNFRSQFTEVINKKSYEELVKTMKEKLEERRKERKKSDLKAKKRYNKDKTKKGESENGINE